MAYSNPHYREFYSGKIGFHIVSALPYIMQEAQVKYVLIKRPLFKIDETCKLFHYQTKYLHDLKIIEICFPQNLNIDNPWFSIMAFVYVNNWFNVKK